MRSPKAVGATIAVVLAVLVSFGATPASATTLCTAGTLTAPCTSGHPGGAFTLTATNFAQAPSGGAVLSCTDVALSGTAPATSATTVSIPVSLAMSGCALVSPPVTVTVPTTCQADGATPITLNVMWNQASAPQAALSLTIPSGCTITYDSPLAGCTMTIAGPQTMGNGTSGSGGIAWTNGSATVRSTAVVNLAQLPSLQSSGGGFLCPAAGFHTASNSGTFSVTSPSSLPGMTVIP